MYVKYLAQLVAHRKPSRNASITLPLSFIFSLIQFFPFDFLLGEKIMSLAELV